MKVLFALIPITILLLLGSCKKDKYLAEVPSYIKVDRFIVKTDSINQGSASSRITDVWVYGGSDFLGAFELPATIPLKKRDLTELTLMPGIYNNGIKTTRAIFPFYTHYSVSNTLTQDSVVNVSPEVTYKSNVVFKWIESFDGLGVSLLKSTASDTSIIVTKELGVSKDGSNCAGMQLKKGQDLAQMISTYSYVLPSNKEIYMELDFKCDFSFAVGITADNGVLPISSNLIILNPTSVWKKIYVNLSSFVAQNQNSIFTFYFRMDKGSDIESASFYIDNIKVVHE